MIYKKILESVCYELRTGVDAFIKRVHDFL